MNPNPLHVETVNRVAATATELSALLRESLAPFVGKKIHRVTPCRAWTAQSRAIVEPIEESFRARGFRVFFRHSEWRIDVEIDATYPTGNGSVAYVKKSFGVGSIRDGDTLKELWEIAPFRSDFTPEIVRSNLAEIEALQSRIRELELEIAPFVR
tara:strand:+ start:1186 stop:1650 length:465 start_codon:yes stop_codon:yes gene_type:complete